MADQRFGCCDFRISIWAHIFWHIQLWNSHEFTDVTLATVDNEQIEAHKVILSACSPFFRNILIRNQHQKPLIYLKDVHSTDLTLLLEYIYHGECQVANEDLRKFITLGEELEINGLIDQPKNYETRKLVNIEES